MLPRSRVDRLSSLCAALAFGLAVVLLGRAASAAPAATSEDLFPAPTFVIPQGSSTVEDLATDKTWPGLASAHCVAVSPHGKRLLVSSASTTNVYLVDAYNGRKLARADPADREADSGRQDPVLDRSGSRAGRPEPRRLMRLDARQSRCNTTSSTPKTA